MVKEARKRAQSRRSGGNVLDVETVDRRKWAAIVFFVLLVPITFLFSDQFLEPDRVIFNSDPLQASHMFRYHQINYMAEHGLSVPQWMPHQFAGMPFVEAFHSDIYYPPSLALKSLRIMVDDDLTVLDVARDLNLLLFLHIFFAGIFMYRAARQFKLTRIPSLLAGASYMLAGILVSWVAPGHDAKIFVAALFPALILYLERGFEEETFWLKLRHFSVAGLVLGFINLSPHAQMSYFSHWALTFYAAFRLIVIWMKQGSFTAAIKPGLLVTYAVIIGVGISAIQMVPGVLYTNEYSPRADTKKGWDWATSWSMHQEEAASLIIPEFSGTATQKPVGAYYWGRNAFKDNSEWLGTISFFIALFGLFYYRRRKIAWFLGGLGLFAVLYGLGGTTPFFRIMFLLVPKVDSMRGPSMIMFLGSFSVAMLAGMGLQAIIDSREDAKGKLSDRFNYVLFGFPAFLFVLAAGFSLAGRSLIDLYSWIFYSDASTQLVQQGVTKLDVGYMNLAAIQPGAWLAFFFCGLTALFIWMYRTGKVGSGILIALVALMIVDGVRFNNRFFGLVDQNRLDYLYAENAVTRYFQGQEGEFRVLNLGTPKDANLPVHGIDLAVGYHGNQLRWYDDLLGGPGLTTVPERHLIARGLLANPRFINLVGVRYMIDPTQGRYPADHFGLPTNSIGDIGGAKLLHNPNAFPRVFLVDRYRVVDGDTVVAVSNTDTTRMRHVVIETLHGDADLRRVVLLEESPGFGVVPGDSVMTDSAWIIDYQAEKVLVGVSASQDRILVMTDTWFPSWRATVDGQPARILRADGAFRAVNIPAGSKQVQFEYYSERYATGRWVTGLTIVYLFGIIGFSIFLSRGRALPIISDEEDADEEETDEE